MTSAALVSLSARQTVRLQTAGGQGVASLQHPAALVPPPALTDKEESKMTQRGQITGGANASLGGDLGDDGTIQQRKQAVEHDRPHPGVAGSEHVGPGDDHGPHHFRGEGWPHPRAMAAHQIHLQHLRIGGLYADLGEPAETRVHPVDRVLTHACLPREFGRAFYPLTCPGREERAGPSAGQRFKVLQRERMAVDLNGGWLAGHDVSCGREPPRSPETS